MVTAPKCKICGHAHFGAAHILANNGETGDPKDTPRVERMVNAIPHSAPPLIIRASELPGKPAPKRDRAAYMRAYRAK